MTINNDPHPPFCRKESIAHMKGKVRIAQVVDKYYSTRYEEVSTVYEHPLPYVWIDQVNAWVQFWADVCVIIFYDFVDAQGKQERVYTKLIFECDDPSHGTKRKLSRDQARDEAYMKLNIPTSRFKMAWLNGRKKSIHRPALAPLTEQEIIDASPQEEEINIGRYRICQSA